MTNSLAQRIALGASAWAQQNTTRTVVTETVRDSKGYLTEMHRVMGYG